MNDSLISSTTIASKVGRKPDGRFAPRNRANPHGRPAGSRNKATIALEKPDEELWAKLFGLSTQTLADLAAMAMGREVAATTLEGHTSPRCW